jgi:uncharacterized protein (TIGR02217 family)
VAFKDIQFPPAISFNATGGPMFLTDVVIKASGAEARNQNWSYERLTYEVSHAARREVDWRKLQAFFRIVAGRAHSFRFKDWTDYQASASEGKFITIDATHAYLAKRYTYGAETRDRKITKPVSGQVTFTGGSGLSLDYATGILTHGTIPSAWEGEFDVHVRFDTDEMRHVTIDKQPSGELIVGWDSIPLIEVRD